MKGRLLSASIIAVSILLSSVVFASNVGQADGNSGIVTAGEKVGG